MIHLRVVLQYTYMHGLDIDQYLEEVNLALGDDMLHRKIYFGATGNTKGKFSVRG